MEQEIPSEARLQLLLLSGRSPESLASLAFGPEVRRHSHIDAQRLREIAAEIRGPLDAAKEQELTEELLNTLPYYRSDFTALKLLAKSIEKDPAIIIRSGNHGDGTLIHEAVYYCNEDALRIIFQYPESSLVIDALDSSGFSALHRAVFEPPSNGAEFSTHLRIIAQLLEAGADINQQQGKRRVINGETPEMFIQVVACDAEGYEGMTPLMMAVHFEDRPIFNVLLKNHLQRAPESLVDFSIRDQRGNDILSHAKQASDAYFLEILTDLQNGIAPSLVERTNSESAKKVDDIVEKGPAEHDDAPSSIVCASSIEKVQALLAQGADINARGSDGETALHWACAAGDIGLIVFLLKNGADHNLTCSRGMTPFEWLAERRAPEPRQLRLALAHVLEQVAEW